MAAVHVAPLLLALAACGREDPTAACEHAAGHVERLLESDPNADAIRDVVVRRCTIDRWSAAMHDCLRATTSTADRRGCRAHLTDDQNAQLDRDLGRFIPPTRGVPDSCRAYERALAPLLTCDALARELRDDLAAKLAEHQRAWTATADRVVLDGQCRAGLTALRQLAELCR